MQYIYSPLGPREINSGITLALFIQIRVVILIFRTQTEM